ncbi:MAG: ABC transporter permease [Candidatus Aminicenantes bacterium]|nr:ABC transporter permease [Candidatus Aminicenantes bacterium]
MKTHLLKLYMSELRNRRKKTALITFAIGWGALSLLLLMSFGRGMSETFSASFKGLGDNILIVYGGQTSKIHQGLPKGRRIRLYPEDVDLLRSRIPEIAEITPESFSRFEMRNGDRAVNRNVNGVNPCFGFMRNQIPQAGGRFVNDLDIDGSRRVVFLGWKVAEELFGDENPVGRRISLQRVPFTVIGVMKRKLQSSAYEGMDSDQVYIPFTTFLNLYSQRFVDRIHIQPEKREQSKWLEAEIRRVLGRKYRFDPKDEYANQIWNTVEGAEMSGKVFKGIEIFLAIIGGLTLLIGAVGVTNLMYAVVKERTREIGVKMALGAKRRHIVYQFLLEAMMIFVKGTMWGGLVAFNIVALVRMLPISYDVEGIAGYLLRPRFSADIFLLFVTVMGILVFMSGIFPALRASRLNPVDALRYE